LITNTGKTILSKYLIGQAPAYASYIALGVGSIPLDDTASFSDYSAKTALDFEVLRIPISSRGYVYGEGGVSNIVFAAELPGDQRYQFTEIGIFSAKSNPAAGGQDSRIVYSFSESENWEYHNRVSATAPPTIIEPLSGELEGSIINPLNNNSQPVPVFRTNSNNPVFNSEIRSETYELPRFLDRALIVSGDMSHIESTAGLLSVKESTVDDYYGTHIHLTGISPNFNRNSSQDEMRLAFSVLNKSDNQTERVGGVRILMEFASSDSLNPENFARFEVDLGPEDVDFAFNRYIVVTKKLGDLVKSTGFTWNTVNSVKMYVMIFDDATETPSDNFYVALDGFRLENITAQNPLYGMTGYSVIRTEDARPILKESNTSSIVEFRFGMDVA
jgi:hypothetical protein